MLRETGAGDNNVNGMPTSDSGINTDQRQTATAGINTDQRQTATTGFGDGNVDATQYFSY